MKTLREIQQNYLAIDFFMSMSCNKDCHYCTSYTLEMRNLTVDMDFLKQTLDYLKNYKIRVCLLGGEPGLIKNLDDVINEIKKYYTGINNDENYENSLSILASAKNDVFDFFDNVKVNEENEILRKNRLELINMLCKTFQNFINFQLLKANNE